MRSILIASSSQSFAAALAEQLGDQFQVYSCQTGLEALSILRAVEPEFAVIDLCISGIDGIEVLKLAKDVGICPMTVAISGYITDYVTAAMEELQVCALIRLPCDVHCLAAKVFDVAAWKKQERTIEDRVREMLNTLNFKPKTAGYAVTQACICAYYKDPYQQLMNTLYPTVALQCDGTVAQVERSLRFAIESAWKRRNEQVWRMYFPAGKNGKIVKPTNAVFLSRIVECLQRSSTDQKEKHLAV